MKGASNVLITVIYRNGRMGMVDAPQLDKLIHSKGIKKFLRSEGWVTIGADPVRKICNHYEGREKRYPFLSLA